MVVAVCGGNGSWCNCCDHAQSALLQGRAGRHVGESARASSLASIRPSLLRLERRNRSDNLGKYTASPAYGEPYLADVDFGTSTSRSHLTFNTTEL